MFSLVSNWIEPVDIPTRDRDVWGVEFVGDGLWSTSSVGRAAYLTVAGAWFLEHDLMDIVGVAGREEWDAGLGDIAKQRSYWTSSFVVTKAGGHHVPLKHQHLDRHHRKRSIRRSPVSVTSRKPGATDHAVSAPTPSRSPIQPETSNAEQEAP